MQVGKHSNRTLSFYNCFYTPVRSKQKKGKLMEEVTLTFLDEEVTTETEERNKRKIFPGDGERTIKLAM